MQRDKSYIGETKRKFSTLLKEHQKAVEHKHSHKSALAEHCLCSGHTVSWEAAKFYAQVLIGATDAFLKHGKSTLAGIP